jgi:protein SCO1/2
MPRITEPPTSSRQTPPSHRPRSLGVLAGGLLVGGLVLVVATLADLGVVHFGARGPDLTGAVIDKPFAAPDFQLQDQFDQPVRLSSERGKVVVLTFLYTNCPDACPIITEKLHQAYGQLGPDASKIAIIAVTVDPAHDTIPQVRTYSLGKDMMDKWHYLVGSESELAPIWKAYGVEAVDLGAQAAAAQASAVADNQPTPTPLPASILVDHSSPVYIVDPAGNARAILDVNFAPSDLVQDVHALLAG